MKLIKAGKVLSDDDAEITKGAKLMLIRMAKKKLVRLVLREIVSGRVVRDKIEIDPAMPHGQQQVLGQ